MRVNVTRSGLAALVCVAMTLFTLTTTARASAAGNDLELLTAVQDRDRDLVRTLLDQGVDVNVQRADGTTALHWAAQWSDLVVARLLVDAGAAPDASTDLGVTPLSLACTNGHAALVEMLLNAGADANTTRSTGETVLMTCARTGDIDSVGALLSHGADVSRAEGVQGQTALMWAAAQNHADVVSALIKHGAGVNVATRKAQFTPLLFAAREGATEAIQVLLDSGADINGLAADGTGPLVAAIYTGHWDLARFLLTRGADPNEDASGYVPLHWAAGSWENDISGIVGPDGYEWIGARGPGKLELVKALLDSGADPNARIERRPPRFGYGSGSRLGNFSGATPFILSALGGLSDIMRELLAAGADPFLTAADGSTALMAAAGYGRIHGESRVQPDEGLQAVKLALDAGIDINAANLIGETALHGAAYFQVDPVVQFLLDMGAEVNALNAAGETPLVLAEGFIGSDTGGNTFYSESTAELLRAAGGSNIMEFSGTVRSFEVQCPVPLIVINSIVEFRGYGAGVKIKTRPETQYGGRSCEELDVGDTVRITATRLGHLLDEEGQPWDGSVDASVVEIVEP